MNQRHLVLAYVATWVIQLSYAAFLTRKWFALRKAESEYPTYQSPPE
jgi:hypothetical protein